MEARSHRTSAAVAIGLAALCTLCSVVGLAFEFLSRSAPVPVDFGSRASTTATAVVFMVMPVVGALIATRQPGNPIGWLFIAIGATMAIWVMADGAAVYSLLTNPAAFGGGAWLAWLASWVWAVGWALTGVAFLLFPTGRLLSPGWRWVIVLLAVGAAVGVALTAFNVGPFENYKFVDNPAGVWHTGLTPFGIKVASILALVVGGIPAVASLFVRQRRADVDERHQIKWVTWAACVAVMVIAAFLVLRALGGRVEWIESTVLMVGVLIPISAGIAVLKYRLYGIDVVINKTLVFGVLATFVTLVYIAVVVGIGALVGAPHQPTPGLSIVATALVAVAFEPLRVRTQRLANRVVYGDRATPYETLAALSASMASAVAPDDMLPGLARVIGEGLLARRTTVWIELDGRLQRRAEWPERAGDIGDGVSSLPLDHTGESFFPVSDRNELLGAVSVETAPGDHLDPSRSKLVVDLSRQAGLVLRNVRLIAELRSSRHRIVAAGDAERRRLERDLHDGAQQQLVALAIKLGLAERLVDADPEKAREMLVELRTDAGDALETLRDLARGIYPPLLADGGVIRALEAQVAKSPLPVTLHADGVGRYPQDVEVALYFCCLEALQNVGKYAHATQVRIELDAKGRELRFAVIDDGDGFDLRHAQGSGLRNMADRLAALDGKLTVTSAPGAGTTIAGRLPASPVIDLNAPADEIVKPAV
jgi:signal transduction histidine kinase